MRRKRTYFKGIKTALSKAVEFPIECTGAYPSIELIGKCEIRIYGCTRIDEYSRTRIAFSSVELKADIEGDELVMSDFTGGGVLIHGVIRQISLS